MTNIKIGMMLVASSVGLDAFSSLLLHVNLFNGIAHAIFLCLTLFTAILGLKKMAIEINKNVSLNLTPDQLKVILKGLEDLPYRFANPVMIEIHQQVSKQFEIPEEPESVNA